MKIGVIGGGVVGGATAYALRQKGHEAAVWDVVEERRSAGCSLADALAGDLVLLCLPTPMLPDGSCDASAVEGFLGAHIESDKCFVVRSTVPPGTCLRLSRELRLPNLCHWPEFLTARKASIDALHPKRNLVGVPEPGLENKASKVLTALLVSSWPHVPLRLMRSCESELVKLAQNSFSAVKIAFFNELRAFADHLGLAWDKVLDGLLLGRWIVPEHTSVPGPDGQRGFGGACLPKDLANLIKSVERAGFPAWVMRAAHDRNNLIDRPQPEPEE